MRILILISRLVVGSLFIVSGLIKANDPLGFSYKLEEYFAESALNLPFLEPYALALAVLACLAEIVLGFAVLFGGRMKLATTALLVLTIFFGWLTAYTATCDPNGVYTVMVDGQQVERGVTCVTDCGCFGDAMKGSVGRSLTPWESFTKDAILFVFILPLFIQAWRKGISWNNTGDDIVLLPFGLTLVAVWSWIFTWWGPVWFTLAGFAGYLIIKRALQGPKAEWVTAAFTGLITLVLTWYAVAHLPIRDYRPYAVGRNIADQKVMGKPPVQQIFLLYRNKNTGEITEYDSKGSYPWDDEANFEFVDQRVVVVEEGIESPVQDFHLVDRDDYDMTEDVLNEEGPVLLITMYNVERASASCMQEIAALAGEAQRSGWYVFGVSASGWDRIEEIRHEHQLSFDFVQCDEKTVKTAVRSNPGILLLKRGTVMGKWHCNDTPTFQEAASLMQ